MISWHILLSRFLLSPILVRATFCGDDSQYAFSPIFFIPVYPTLHEAVRAGDHMDVKRHFRRRSNINGRDLNDMTALHLATYFVMLKQ